MTEEKFIEVLESFKKDTNKGWLGHMTLSIMVNKAIEIFGIERTAKIMKQEFGE